MIFHVHKVEALVKFARSKSISKTRQIVVKFFITCCLCASQLVLMVTVMLVALLEDDHFILVINFAAYLLVVSITDAYLHAYVVLKAMLKLY